MVTSTHTNQVLLHIFCNLQSFDKVLVLLLPFHLLNYPHHHNPKLAVIVGAYEKLTETVGVDSTLKIFLESVKTVRKESEKSKQIIKKELNAL